MVKQLRFGLFFFVLTLFTTTGFSQEWYDLIEQEPVNIEEVKKSAEQYFNKIGRGKHTGHKQYQRWLYNATINMDKNGVPYTNNHVAAELKKFRANSSKSKQRRAVGDADNNWTPIGPFFDQNNTDGRRQARLPAMAVEPNDQQLLFAGSEGGGIWRSRDAGASWTPLGDQFDNMFITAIGIDPHNSNHVLYLNRNTELMESFDQGDSWNLLKNFNDNNLYGKMISFHPTNSQVYFVTTDDGLMKMTNGTTFNNVLKKDLEDVFFKPEDPTTMYASGTDFWKSTDTGETWTQITNGISVSSKMKIAVTPADPNRVYILQKDKNSNSFGRIYKSTNSGSSFEIMSDIEDGAPDYISTVAHRCMTIMCSATDPDKLHMGGLRHSRSDDGGVTLYKVENSQTSSSPTYIHDDVLVMQNVNGTLYASSDGGIYRSTDGGANYTALAGNGLMATQVYRIGGTSPHPGTGEGLDPYMILCGTQDNGTKISKGANHDWENWLGSDGMECFIDYTNSNNIYGSRQSGVLYYSKNGSSTFQVLDSPEERGTSPTPFMMDAITPTTLYTGYVDLYMSTNSGNNWEKLTAGQTGERLIRALAVAPTDNNYIYFSEGEDLWVSTNAQSTSRTWTEVSGIPRLINYITVDPNDPLHALIATTGSGVYETKNAGQTWTDISGNLPNIKAGSVLMDDSEENTIYVGMFQGVYYKNDNMTEWELFGKKLPRCDVRELEIHYASKKLRAATYGRGIWEIPIFGTTASISPEVIAETNQKCFGDSIQLSVKENQAWAEPISYQWYRDDVLISGATNVNYDALEKGNYTVEVIANEVSGTSTGTSLTFLEAFVAPSVMDEKICDPGNVTFTATGSGNGIIKWYANEEGTNELAKGNIFSVDVTETSTYYVKETSSEIVSKVGMENKIDGLYYVGGAHLIIDVENPFILKSVKVYAEKAGDRTFELRDASEKLLLSKTVYVEEGESRVTLGFAIPVGDDLRIGIEKDGLNLHRSKGDIAYPFEVEGVVTIKGSSVRSEFYYFLYDWEIQTGSRLAICPSASSEVTVTVDNCVGLSDYENENLTLFPNPTSGLVHLKLPENFELKTIEVTDIQGNSFLTYDKYIERIDLQSFKSGAYLVKVTGEQGIKVFKIEVN